MEITKELVRKLISDQFPHWSELSVNAVPRSGWDNRTFRLGNTLSVRLPSAESYVPQVNKEQQWLPFLGDRLSIAIPEVQALGTPGHGYPWPWSVYNWIEGEDIDQSCTKGTEFVEPLAQFLTQLQSIPTADGPAPGMHNYFRGGNLQHYNADTQLYLDQLAGHINVDTARNIWHDALKTSWSKAPVWIHGDLEASNMLASNGQLTAVIDFGNCAVGDPACDLVMAWTFFDDAARGEFRSQLLVDENTWKRAQAWALWKALFRMSQAIDKQNEEFYAANRLVETILK